MMDVNKDWLLMLHQFLKQPDVIFYLNVTVEAALERIKKRNDDIDFFETFENLLEIKSNYEKLISDGLGVEVCCVETVRKNQTEIVQNVIRIVQERFL